MKTLLLILSLMFFYHSFAETEQSSEDKQTQSDNEQQANTQSESKQTSNTPDTFNPSEKLSQDVPTAFPVDI